MVILKFRPDARLDPQWLFRIVQERSDVALVPPATLKLDLRAAPSAPRRTAPAASGTRPKPKGDAVAAGSWWTARARTGEVTAGFTRDEILRPAKEDPRGETGVFTRVGALLRDLGAGGAVR